MKRVFFLLLVSFSGALLLSSTENRKLKPVYFRGGQPRALLPMDAGQIEEYVQHKSLKELSNGLSPEDVMESVEKHSRMEELLKLINEFHRKMRQVDSEMSDGMSKLNSYIGLTRKFK